MPIARIAAGLVCPCIAEKFASLETTASQKQWFHRLSRAQAFYLVWLLVCRYGITISIRCIVGRFLVGGGFLVKTIPLQGRALFVALAQLD